MALQPIITDNTKIRQLFQPSPRISKSVLFHFDPFPLVNANDVPTFTFDFLFIMNAIVFYDSFFPAVPQSALSNLDVSKDYSVAVSAPYSYHHHLCMQYLYLSVYQGCQICVACYTCNIG